MATTGFDGTGLKQVFNSELGKTYKTQREEMGTIRFDASGNKYQFMKVNEKVDLGMGVTGVPEASMDNYETAGIQKANSTFMILSDGGPTDAGFYNGQYVFSNGGITYRIISQEKSYTTGADDDHVKIHLDKPIITDIADGTTMRIYSPYFVQKIDDVADATLGITINDINESEYSWVQTGGFCMNALVDGSGAGTSISIGESLSPKGSTGAGIFRGNSTSSYTQKGITACNNTSSADVYIPVTIH
tara:strand:+ start:230 stop:967 length:738 start_codon:yes stop_codon:yes gene_type:complete